MNDDRKYQKNKDFVLELLRMGMPNQVIQSYLKLSAETVTKYANRLRAEGILTGQEVSIAKAIPKMLAIIAYTEFNRNSLSLIKIENVDKQKLLLCLNEVLGTESIIDMIDCASRQLIKLCHFGFHEDIPVGYRNLLNALNPQHDELQFDGLRLWHEHLRAISRLPEINEGKESLKIWRNKTINTVVDDYAQIIRSLILPELPFAICKKVDEEIFSILSVRELQILKMYFGIDGPKMNLREISEQLDLSGTSVGSIIHRSIRRLKLQQRLKSIYAVPLTWDTVSKLVSEVTPPKPAKSAKIKVAPEEAMRYRIIDLDISVRTMNFMIAAEVVTLADLLKFSEDDLYKFRNVGKKSIFEITELLRKYRLSLRKE